jgi:hypothetical protein
MEIVRWEDFFSSRFKPSFRVQVLTFGTMPVSAGIVRYQKISAVVTFIFMTSELRGPACFNGSHHT